MKITGFHHDGGFAQFIAVPKDSLVSLPPPSIISDTIGCFAEPVGCVLNAIDKLSLQEGQRVIIYGGGTVGLIAALVCRHLGAIPCVIEKKEEKIKKITPFLEATAISCMKDTVESEFDAVINACADHIAFSLGVVKVARGGKFSFFSGITKNEHLESNLINLLHYKEVELSGAYGLTRKNMLDAVSFMESNIPFLEMLVEDVVRPEEIVKLMPDVLSGNTLKYILDFRDNRESPDELFDKKNSAIEKSGVIEKTGTIEKSAARKINTDLLLIPNSNGVLNELPERGGALADIDFSSPDEKWCRSFAASVNPINKALYSEAQGKIDNKTKPLGALGTLEDLAIQMSLIQQTLLPVIRNKALFVFAGDHGVTEEGVSAYPSEVTCQMVKNFLDGGAAINVLCRHHGIEMKIVDMGVNGEFDDHPHLIKNKIRKGTRNFAIEPAMTHQETFMAVRHGMQVFLDNYLISPDMKHCKESSTSFDIMDFGEKRSLNTVETGKNISLDIVGVGEMGIGNTTSASAIISVITGITPSEATGRGTGIDNKGLEHKAGIIEKAINFHKPDITDGFDILRKIGGYEIAGITGAILAAASKGCAVVLDGVISTAAGLVAFIVNPAIQGYLISGHKSVEIAQKAALDYMGLKPVIDFGMRLGEGTGAALTINTAQAACKIMCEMASFDEAQVSGKRHSS
ncbi:MAG: nicotinate-nucleotide--dimethylbenzimidazole phosphoribosyltransferase [Desulfamplus sp.]|nr:nicotinate-nucleotide--dimethylbenzimidazole phosphoribosyltransferase [Desulfamplus sp.]